MNLIEEVRNSFENQQEELTGRGPISIIRPGDEELAPGFNAMRSYYEERLLAFTRRSYRHYAGGSMPTEADELLRRTGEKMLPALIALELQAYADGVLIGHRADAQVQISFHFHIVDQLFAEKEFRESSDRLASGFSDDTEVIDFFRTFTSGGVENMSHITGFAHHDVDPGKVWDIWLLVGTAVVCSCYLAGHRMGVTWRERDVLDGIEIATEEGTDGPEGEDR
jgi:hypothetical protein